MLILETVSITVLDPEPGSAVAGVNIQFVFTGKFEHANEIDPLKLLAPETPNAYDAGLEVVNVPLAASPLRAGKEKSVPTPERVTLCEDDAPSLSVIVRLPPNVFTDPGWNLTLMVQVALFISGVLQVSDSEYPVGTAILEMIRLPPPAFVTVIVCAALGVFTIWFAKLRLLADSEAVGVPPPELGPVIVASKYQESGGLFSS